MYKLGVFDSGLGGLTVVKELKKKWPGVQIVYLGDTARVPYGTRSPETIIKFSLECAHFLADKGVEKLIIACNTASAYAYEEIKKAVDERNTYLKKENGGVPIPSKLVRKGL